MQTSRNFRSWIGYYYTVFNILIPVVLSIRFPWSQFQETNRIVCNSKECKAMSQDLIHSLKESVNPCTDFYEYVCGYWQNHNSLEPYIGYLSVEALLEYEGYKKLKRILAEPIKPTMEDSLVAKAKTLYKQCMELPYLVRTDEISLKEYMKERGFWAAPSKTQNSIKSWTALHNYYLSISGDSAFFKISLYIPPDAETPYLVLERSSSPYGALHHEFKWEEVQQQKYFKFLEQTIKLITGTGVHTYPFETLQDDLRDVFNFRLLLQKLSISKENPAVITPMTIKELDKWYSSMGCSRNKVGNINWLQLFKSLYANNPNSTMITEDTVIHVHSKDYLKMLCSLLAHMNKRTIVNHIHMYFMERHVTFKPYLKKWLIHSITRGLASNGKIRYIPHQWFACIKSHNMPSVLGSLYTKHFLSESIVKGVNEMMVYIKNIIVSQIESIKWMSESSKQKTIERVKQIKLVIGFPDRSDPQIDPDVYSAMAKSSILSHAFNDIKANAIFISSLYFQQPVYDKNLPFTVTYASLGTLIAHEIYHMFDNDSVATGVMHTIWRKNSVKQYARNAACIADHYVKQPIKELQHKVREKPKLKTQLTRNEDVADVMGLQASYNAYKKMVWDKNGVCTTLPQFQDVPCDRVFFITYARSFCSMIPEEKFIRRLNQAAHSPDRLRVNVPVSNMQEFARAFKCDASSPMNPTDKCNLWT
ncbi:hypothetical protein KPH14_005481 [Odynerus spinipes]|uniref:Uncharacterized protein n=1 Tax=Odynerus spinipes TaxID=1348599 RepID=A0AAD9RC10_9HYME|nr:hypothetical protein KPH14_005481 [Odynerus spinipes]